MPPVVPPFTRFRSELRSGARIEAKGVETIEQSVRGSSRHHSAGGVGAPRRRSAGEEVAQQINRVTQGDGVVSIAIAGASAEGGVPSREEVAQDHDRIGERDGAISRTITAHEGERRIAPPRVAPVDLGETPQFEAIEDRGAAAVAEGIAVPTRSPLHDGVGA